MLTPTAPGDAEEDMEALKKTKGVSSLSWLLLIEDKAALGISPETAFSFILNFYKSKGSIG